MSVNAQTPVPSGCTDNSVFGSVSVYRDTNLNLVLDPGDTKLLGTQLLIPGETVFYKGTLFAPFLCSQCIYFGGVITNGLPDGSMPDATPTGGIPNLCNSALVSGTCGDTCPVGSVDSIDSKGSPYVVSLANALVDNTVPGGLAVSATMAYNGFSTRNPGATATASINLKQPVANPVLTVDKQVACKVAGGSCQTLGGSAVGYRLGGVDPVFCYQVAIHNGGNVALLITNVNDSAIGNIDLALFSGLNAGILATGTTATATFESAHDATTINVVTVSGRTAVDSTVDIAMSGTASATATVTSAGISCTDVTATPSQVVGGTTTNVMFCLNVNNLGDASLSSVTVTDTLTGAVINLGTRAGNTTTNVCYTRSIQVPADCEQFPTLPNDIHVSGVTGGQCPVTPSSDCRVEVQTRCEKPVVCLTKKVACYQGDDTCDTFGEIAYGVRTETQCPAFCYELVVSNCGPVELTDITLNDPNLDLSTCTLPTTLASGASATCIVKAVERCVDLHNTATVTGSGGFPSTVVSNWDSADVVIKPAGISCVKEVSTNGIDYVHTIKLEDNGTDYTVYWRITVTGESDPGVALGNIVVSDPVLEGCDIASQVPATLVGTDSFVINCTETLNCTNLEGGVLVNTVTITADVVATNDIKCVKDMFGNPITVSTTCDASVECFKPLPAGCRTTGGGKQYEVEDQTCPKDVRYVTHGGQVGAPFGAASAPSITNCVTGEGIGFWNECIRGEYQHVRHMKGGRRANFHAASNGKVHQFDSLACACLPCDSFDTSSPWANGPLLTCHPADRTYTNLGVVAEGKKGAICNPGDRMCGPEPRKAPANKISFSGVGSYTDTKGKRVANSVIFRVDIEDRGEPGNAHAIGSNGKDKKIDRYRIRMWKLIGNDGPDSPANRALRVAVAVTDASDERVLVNMPCEQGATPEPFIDDGGDLDRGNRQIHPNTGATCD